MQKSQSIAIILSRSVPYRSVERYAGSQALWMKVIQRAAYDYASYKDDPDLKKRKEADSAYKWMFEPSYLFNSFETGCKFLGVPPEPIRVWAKKLTKQEVRKMEHVDRRPHKEQEDDDWDFDDRYEMNDEEF